MIEEMHRVIEEMKRMVTEESKVLKAENEALRTEKRNRRAENEALREDKRDLTADVEGQRVELAKMRAKMNRKDAAWAQANAELKVVSYERADFEDQCARLRILLDEAYEIIDSQETKIEQLEAAGLQPAEANQAATELWEGLKTAVKQKEAKESPLDWWVGNTADRLERSNQLMVGALKKLLMWDMLEVDDQGRGMVIDDAAWARALIRKALRGET